jgi:ABC-2 type transport system permease protein
VSALSPPSLGGAVYDRGYRPYDGPRGGRSAAGWALWRLTLRRALGLRRSWRQKVLPWTLLGLVTIPAAVDLGVRYATRNTPLGQIDFEFLTFRDYVGVSTMLLLFVAVSAPDVICPDRHDRVLPLIFSRPLTGDDYVLAKVGGIFALVFGFSFLPQVLLYIGQMLVNEDGSLTFVGDHLDVLWKVPLSVGILALYYAVVSVAVASLTDRRIVGGLAFLGAIFIPSIVSAAVVGAANQGEGTIFGVLNLLNLPLMLRDVVFEGEIDIDRDAGLSGVAGAGWAALLLYVAIIAVGLVVLRYRYREARS